MLSPFQVPFTVLQGEGVEYLGHANDAVIAISNYRLHIKFKDSVINVSLALPAPSPLRVSEQGGVGIPLGVVAQEDASWSMPGLGVRLLFCCCI